VLGAALATLEEKFARLAPQLQAVDAVSGGVARLEAAVEQLDEYTKRLEQAYLAAARQAQAPPA
jgi:uncharacterized coiled-coil protein SlyX